MHPHTKTKNIFAKPIGKSFKIREIFIYFVRFVANQRNLSISNRKGLSLNILNIKHHWTFINIMKNKRKILRLLKKSNDKGLKGILSIFIFCISIENSLELRKTNSK